ncbi:hypothetical protein C8J57DRAFT_1293288 [Mycena rebaudengoi]|nr:hypothetical protein C8J57DRAFT_1293288 [Mycena rebaudengoi]
MQTGLKAFIRTGTAQTTRIVREVLKPHMELGLTTKEIYEQAHALFPDEKTPAPPLKQMPRPGAHGRGLFRLDPPGPPHRDHPIRSIAYLKNVVLEELQEKAVVEKVISRTVYHPEGAEPGVVTSAEHQVTQWRWKLVSEERAAKIAWNKERQRRSESQRKQQTPDRRPPHPVLSSEEWAEKARALFSHLPPEASAALMRRPELVTPDHSSPKRGESPPPRPSPRRTKSYFLADRPPTSRGSNPRE